MSTLSKTTSEGKSPQIQVVLALFAAFSSKDYAQLSSLLSEDYIHYVLPKSLVYPTRNKTEWITYVEEVMKMFENFKVSLYHIRSFR